VTAPAALAVVVLVSGRGSNLQALIDACAEERLRAEIRAVISNVPGAAALERARRAGIETQVIDHRGFERREAFDRALAARVEAFAPRLVVLAGFLRVLGAPFVQRFHGRLVNIHPSLLPAFPGLDTHRRALAAGAREHGATVHFVTAELDGGPIIARARVPVLAGDDPQSLAARVLAREHVLLPRVVALFAEGRVHLGDDGRVWRDGAPAPAPLEIGD